MGRNSNTEMPRSYNRDNNTTIGDLYNWYAATAESGSYAATNSHASDSLCPSGWSLPNAWGGSPDGGTTSYKSFANLLENSDYALDSNRPVYSSEVTRSQPLAFSLPGYYALQRDSGYTTQLVNPNRSAHYWTTESTSDELASFYMRLEGVGNNNTFNTRYGSGYKAFGFSIKCVKR